MHIDYLLSDIVMQSCKGRRVSGVTGGSSKLFRERLSEKMCTRQSRKVIWDKINTAFLTL